MARMIVLAVDVWEAVGASTLSALGAALLGGVVHLFTRVRSLERELSVSVREGLTRHEATELIEKAGIYNKDRAVINMRLDQHAQQIADIYKLLTSLQNSQGHMTGKLDLVLREVRRHRGAIGEESDD